jgi:hypothetical protein
MKILPKKTLFFSLILFVPFLLFYKTPPTTKQVALGMWTEGLYDAKTQTLHPEKLVEFERVTNKKYSIAHYYRGWESLSDPKLINEFAALNKNRWQPMLNVNPYYFSECPSAEMPLYKAIAEGKCDNFLHKAGKNLSKVRQPFYLLFAWEMNNDANQWSTTKSGNTPEDFKAAWRHMHKIFKEENATKIIWVFCPNVPDVPSSSYRALYPGDEYVDWVGLDGYNWGTTQSWSQWLSFKDIFTDSYNTITTIAPNKPLMIAEVNSTNQGGDKQAWYLNTFEHEIPEKFPKISAVVVFNEDKTVQEKVNWKVDITPESLQGFIKGVHHKYYK